MWKKLEFNRNEIAASSQIEIHFRKLDKYIQDKLEFCSIGFGRGDRKANIDPM